MQKAITKSNKKIEYNNCIKKLIKGINLSVILDQILEECNLPNSIDFNKFIIKLLES
jgi:hypothetical protein